jgi:hypothetical protein
MTYLEDVEVVGVVDDVLIHTKLPRAEIVELLRMRDGDMCQHPDCNSLIDFDLTEGHWQNTIDHWMPQSYGRANGWTEKEIWDLDNLKMMHRKCNAKKGDLIPNPDGTIPAKPTRTWKNRRAKRSQRPEICTACNAGRNLGENEHCRACGSGPQPERLPKWRQMKPSDCDHNEFFCWSCHLNPEIRKSAIMSLIAGSESSE